MVTCGWCDNVIDLEEVAFRWAKKTQEDFEGEKRREGNFMKKEENHEE